LALSLEGIAQVKGEITLETMVHIDKIDAKLLDLIQKSFPLTSRPFDAIARELAISPEEVKSRITRLKSDSIIRQISAIFDSAALGYRSALIALEVKPELLDTAGATISRHSGVSHCYARDAKYNLWLTLTVGPESDLEQEAVDLAGMEWVESCITLPATKIYKIGVFLDMAGETPSARLKEQTSNRTLPNSQHPAFDFAPGSEPRAAVRVLQKDLPIIDTPFSELAREAGMRESELLSLACMFLEKNVMRRFAAVLKHQRAGYSANAMACWKVEPEKADEAGAIFAANPAVSHCYERATYPDWPYSLYTMIHRRTEEELSQTISDLVNSSGLPDYRVLRTVKEYKKSRVKYFL